MTSIHQSTERSPEYPGIEFGRSVDNLPVARIGDLVFAMVSGRQEHFIASAWRVTRPLAELRRDDFYSHHGAVADEAAFRNRMIEQAEHSRQLALLSRKTVRMNCHTPWGPSQGATVYADGIVAHTTAGHGGFKLSPERNVSVHPMLRNADGYYEEDECWAAVAFTFPDLFTTYERRCAERTIKDSFPDAWEVVSGETLLPGESRTKDRRAFEAEHISDWIVTAAILSDHRPGMTEVVAVVGGKHAPGREERRFLVPSDEYEVGRFGFVIDPERHISYDGPSSFVGWQRRQAS